MENSSRTNKHVIREGPWEISYLNQLKELLNYCFKSYHIFEIQNNLAEGPLIISFMSSS